MLDAAFATMVMTSCLWIYWDATSHGIGRVPGVVSVFNMSAGAWASAALLLWIVAFPAYLLNRNALLRRAKEHPVKVTNRSVKLVVLAVAGITLMRLSLAIGTPPEGGMPVPDAGGGSQYDPAPG
jgi:hypothetical protein